MYAPCHLHNWICNFIQTCGLRCIPSIISDGLLEKCDLAVGVQESSLFGVIKLGYLPLVKLLCAALCPFKVTGGTNFLSGRSSAKLLFSHLLPCRGVSFLLLERAICCC